MPSLATARRISGMHTNNAMTVGEILKTESDFVMEETWDNDIQSKVCYIYDYFHDDQPRLNKGMTYENTTKTKIDIKFIVTTYGSLSKDQVEFHIMFKPSQPVNFTEKDDLYYFETDYVDRYSSEFPIGLYIDIPDDKGVYRKWLICSRENGNQFIKYSVIPCDYELMWIELKDNIRIKRKMWCCLRSQNSYTSGLWTDLRFTSLDNVNMLWLPINSISENINYLGEDNEKNQRLIISALVKNPTVWRVSKIQNISPLGIIKVTYKQASFNPNTDYIDMTTKEMYADYYDNDIKPIDLKQNDELIPKDVTCQITTATNILKIGGSYKTLTAKFFDKDDVEITDRYKDSIFTWSIDDKYDPYVTWGTNCLFNQRKIKFNDNRKYLEQIITVKCETENIIGTIQLELNV